MPTKAANTYLDYNATTPTLPIAKTAMIKALDCVGNASSVHRDGRQARSLIEDARESVARLSASDPGQVTFTSGATEANAIAIGAASSQEEIHKVFCSAVEHPSVRDNVPQDCHLPVNADGLLNLEALREVLKTREGTLLVCVMAANNETGVVQPIEEIASLIREHECYLMCDMVQIPGKLLCNKFSVHADVITLSAHKFGGPKGIGALINKSDLNIKALYGGGGQERSIRSGTENVSGIVGFGAVAHEVSENPPDNVLDELRDRFEQAIQDVCADAVIFGRDARRLPNTTCVAVPGRTSEQQLIKLDLAGFSVSAGSACSSGKIAASHVLLAMGVSPELAKGSLRISIGKDTQWEDLERFVDAWSKA